MRKRACLVALLTLASGQLTPAAAHAAPAVPPLVEGVLDGVAPGALSLYAWPPTSGMQVGQTADLVPLGAAPVDRDGAFRIDAEPTQALQALAAQNGGYVNFELRGRPTSPWRTSSVTSIPARPRGAPDLASPPCP